MTKTSFFPSLWAVLRRVVTLSAFVWLLSCFAHGQATVFPFQALGQAQFFDNNGALLTSGVLYSFQAGSSTQQATYTDSTGTVLNPNPIPFGSGARVQIWLLAGAFYKFVLCSQNDGAFCSPGDVLFSVDQVPGSPSAVGSGSSAPFISNSPNPSTTGILRLASSDAICWRNAANSANLCITKDNADVLSWASGQMKFPENACGNAALNFDYLCANASNHRWTMTNNGGSAQQIVGAGVDINTSDQVTQLHFGATPIPLASTPPSAAGSAGGGPYMAWNGTSLQGGQPGIFYVNNDPVTGTQFAKLAKINSSGNAVILSTSDPSPAGVVEAGQGTTGQAILVHDGIDVCSFDGATTAGDYVSRSGISGGQCHDAGTVRTPATFAQVLSTNGGTGNYNIAWLNAAANPILVFANQTLGSNVGISGNVLTTIIQKTVTMPASGCPCRAIADWSLHLTSSSSEIMDADVTDGSNHFAGSSFNMTGSVSYTGIAGSGTSNTTYASGQTVTFTLELENNNNGMIVQAAANFGGFGNSYLQISIVASN